MSVLKRKVAKLESFDVECDVQRREDGKLVLTIAGKAWTHVETWDETGNDLLHVVNNKVQD